MQKLLSHHAAFWFFVTQKILSLKFRKYCPVKSKTKLTDGKPYMQTPVTTSRNVDKKCATELHKRQDCRMSVLCQWKMNYSELMNHNHCNQEYGQKLTKYMPISRVAGNNSATDRANDGCIDPRKMPRLFCRLLGKNLFRHLQLCMDCLQLHIQRQNLVYQVYIKHISGINKFQCSLFSQKHNHCGNVICRTFSQVNPDLIVIRPINDWLIHLSAKWDRACTIIICYRNCLLYS